jgi:hypothetical protein
LFYVFFAFVAASREHQLPVGNYLQAWSLHCMMLAVVIALTLLGSLLLSSVAANATMTVIITAGILLVGRHLHKVGLRAGEISGTLLTGIYYLIPHLELFDVRDLIIHNWPLIAWPIWGIAVLYAMVYAALLLFASWLVFRKKAF